MHFQNARRVEAGTLKLAVHVGGEDKGPVFHPASPGLQDPESLMRQSGAVQVEPMTVETPGQCRIGGEPLWVRQGSKAETELLVGRVGFPESLVPAESGQPGVDPHAGSRCNQERIGRCHGLDG